MTTEERLARLEGAVRELLLVVTEGQPEVRLTRMVDARASSAGRRLLDLLEVIDAERSFQGANDGSS